MTRMVLITYKDEASLIEGCRKQDRHAQKELFAKYHQKMMRICVRYLRDEEEAFEVLNYAFFKIFDKINQFKPETKLESWIRRVVVNSIIDHIRKNKTYKNNFIRTDEFFEYGEPICDDDDISQFWDKASSITEDVFLIMVNELPPATRVVFNMYAIEEFNHRQIAKHLNISEGTSKWHLSNARQQLKKKLIELINQSDNQHEIREFKKY